jgi:hypothetical protein
MRSETEPENDQERNGTIRDKGSVNTTGNREKDTRGDEIRMRGNRDTRRARMK